VPADDGLGFHEQHDVHEAVEAAGQGTDEPAIESAQARAFDLASDDDELLAKDQVFGDQGCSGRDEGQDDVEPEAKEGDHGSAYHDGLFLARRASVRGRVVRAGRARIWRRYGHVTVGETGADPAHDGVFAPHSRGARCRNGITVGDTGQDPGPLRSICAPHWLP
jgi:hypothetical protein